MPENGFVIIMRGKDGWLGWVFDGPRLIKALNIPSNIRVVDGSMREFVDAEAHGLGCISAEIEYLPHVFSLYPEYPAKTSG